MRKRWPMETEIFNLLLNGGPFGAVAAFFFYRWQKAEGELKEERAANALRNDANHKAMLDLQEKRMVDAVRTEGVVGANTTAMTALQHLVQALVSRGTGA